MSELAHYLHDQREFSRRTFGDGTRTLGIIKHIRKELEEVLASPDNLEEWVDVFILACDGFWRHGGRPEDLMPMVRAKLETNKSRTWPAPTSEDEAIEHVRSGYEMPQPPEAK